MQTGSLVGRVSRRRNPTVRTGGGIGMDILSTIVLLAVVFAFAYMALDAGRRAK